MRGKKIDSEFVVNFIQQCVSNNIVSSNEIVNEAKNKISNIDEQIKQVEQLKRIRSKYLDVIESLKKEHKDISSDIVSFFDIKDIDISRYICLAVKHNVSFDEIINCGRFKSDDIFFCIKQLLEHKIIVKDSSHFIKHDSYDKYMNQVLKEE